MLPAGASLNMQPASVALDVDIGCSHRVELGMALAALSWLLVSATSYFGMIDAVFTRL